MVSASNAVAFRDSIREIRLAMSTAWLNQADLTTGRASKPKIIGFWLILLSKRPVSTTYHICGSIYWWTGCHVVTLPTRSPILGDFRRILGDFRQYLHFGYLAKYDHARPILTSVQALTTH